jgi:hypothetical protein
MATELTPLELLYGPGYQVGLPASPGQIKAELLQLITRANAIVTALNTTEDLAAANASDIDGLQTTVTALQATVDAIPTPDLSMIEGGFFSYARQDVNLGGSFPSTVSIETFTDGVFIAVGVYGTAEITLPGGVPGSVANGQIKLIYRGGGIGGTLTVGSQVLAAGQMALLYKEGEAGLYDGNWRVLFNSGA